MVAMDVCRLLTGEILNRGVKDIVSNVTIDGQDIKKDEESEDEDNEKYQIEVLMKKFDGILQTKYLPKVKKKT